MKLKKCYIIVILLVICVGAIFFRTQLRQSVVAAIQIVKGEKTVANRVAQFGDTVRTRLATAFDQVGVTYPPRKVSLVGLKTEKSLQVWVTGPDGEWKHLKNYPILGMSGVLGPKLKEGDMQVPEGIYRVDSLNPNSLYHLALRLNYPNAEDRRRGKEDGRKELGSEIMIHGENCSIGCLAMGNEAAEDLFILAAETGINNITVVLSPVDFRNCDLPKDMPPVPAWTPLLYDSIKQELKKMKTPT